MTKKEREIIRHLETRPEACVIYASDVEEKGYHNYHYFPLEFIEGKRADKTTMYYKVLEKTGDKQLALRVVRWAKNAKPGKEWHNDVLSVWIEGGE